MLLDAGTGTLDVTLEAVDGYRVCSEESCRQGSECGSSNGCASLFLGSFSPGVA